MPYRLVDDSDESFRDFFYESMPETAGLFNAVASKSKADFDILTDDADTSISQDSLLDNIAQHFVDHPELDKARELVNSPSLRTIVTVGFAGQCYKEFQHANALGPMLAAGLISGAENRDKIWRDFTKPTNKIVKDLTELHRLGKDLPENVVYGDFSIGSRRLFVLGMAADMMLAMKTEFNAKQNGSTVDPDKRLDLGTIGNLIMREAYAHMPVVYDRGDAKMFEKTARIYNAMASLQGLGQRLHWDGEMLSRRKAPAPKQLPSGPA